MAERFEEVHGVFAGLEREDVATLKMRIAELEAALRPLAVWGMILKPDAPRADTLSAVVPHLSLTIGHAKDALAALGRDKLVCPICEGACSTQH